MNTIDLEFNNNLKKIVNKYIDSENDEIELEAIINKNITSEQLYKLLGVLKYKYSNSIKTYVYLNVYNKNIRFTINTIQEIKDFYNNEKIEGITDFLQKVKLDEFKDNNYDIKFTMKTETKPSNLNINSFKDNYKQLDKTYRFIERYSFITNEIRFDISIVKSGNGLSIIESNVFMKPITYEIELEYLNKNNSIENIIKNFYEYIFLTIQIVDTTPFILKNKEKLGIKNEYMTLINHVSLGPRVIGMSDTTIRNISNEDIDNDRYLITPKADGEKHILYINKLGLVYMIDNNNVIDTNLICNVKNSVIDGEFIKTYNSSTTLFNISFNHTNMNQLFSYQAFDIYYLNGEVVYNLELPERLNLIKSIDFQKNNQYSLDFNIKPFYNINEVNTIINDDTNKKLKYNIDGIIFQPIDAYNNKNVLNVNNYKILKWKPEKYNSIDFLINIDYDKDNTLKVVFSSLYSYKLFNKNITQLKPFSSIRPYIYNINIQYEDNIPMTEENTKVENNTIVECRYDINSKKWIYMRTRTDKTKIYQQGITRSTANNIFIANDIFASIYFPITTEHITNITNMKKLINSSNDYYYNYKQNYSERTDMQKFHNKIKNILIQQSVKHLSTHFNTIKCLDLGIGHGGDIKKYINTNHYNYNPNNKIQKGISFILGIEFNKQNIEYYNFSENKYGSRAKFLNISTEYSNTNVPNIIKNNDCYILQGDLNLDNLNKNTKLFINDYDKKTFDIIWNLNKLDKNPFELIISNFSFHYFIENQFKYNNILKTISNNLQDNNGLFIMTFLDGQRIIDLFKKEKTMLIDCGFATIRKIDEFNKKKFGTKIGIKLKTMETEYIEYLVDFNILVEQFNKHKLYLSSTNYIDEDTNKNGFFEDIYFKYSYKLGVDEKYSYLHRYAIFQKNTKIVNKKSIVKNSIVKNSTKQSAGNNTNLFDNNTDNYTSSSD